MKTHSCTEVKHLKSEFPFYDFDNLAILGGTMYLIKAPDKYDGVRYGDMELGNCSASFYLELERILLDFLDGLFNAIQEEECIIIKYESQWVVRESETPELSLFLHTNGINDSVGGITADKHDTIVRAFTISSFRYNSFIQFLFPRSKIIITPTDHMDLFLDIPTSSSSVKQIDLRLEDKG